MNHLRQLDIFNPRDFVWPVNIIGLGGIGSAAGLALVKLGISELRLWDNDVLEEHNIPNQLLYRADDIGKPKVTAAFEILKGFNRQLKIQDMGVFDPEVDSSDLDGLVVSALHSMERDSQGREGRNGIWRAV